MTYFFVSTYPCSEAHRPTAKLGLVTGFPGDLAWRGLGDLTCYTLEDRQLGSGEQRLIPQRLAVLSVAIDTNKTHGHSLGGLKNKGKLESTDSQCGSCINRE